jgi:hypothetical protein
MVVSGEIFLEAAIFSWAVLDANLIKSPNYLILNPKGNQT